MAPGPSESMEEPGLEGSRRAARTSALTDLQYQQQVGGKDLERPAQPKSREVDALAAGTLKSRPEIRKPLSTKNKSTRVVPKALKCQWRNPAAPLEATNPGMILGSR